MPLLAVSASIKKSFLYSLAFQALILYTPKLASLKQGAIAYLPVSLKTCVFGK